MIREGDYVITPAGTPTDDLLMQWAEERGYFETVGKRQAELLMRAREARGRSIALIHDRKSSADRLAARRLVERKLFKVPKIFGSPRMGYLYQYELTDRGAQCWLKVLR